MKTDRPSVYVLSCKGGAQGELGVVRSLGRRGLRVVVVSQYETISASSKYCTERHVVPRLLEDVDATIQTLVELAAGEGVPPVLFPTADPDLMFVSRHRDKLTPVFRTFLSSQEIIENLVDKAKFFDYSQRYGLPTPKTTALSRTSDVGKMVEAYTFPVILKPILPSTWGSEPISSIVDGKKAVLAHSKAHLLDIHRQISDIDDQMVLQEYVPGRDDRLFSYHAYIDIQGEQIWDYTGQKVRTYPPYAGIGCYVKSVDRDDLKALGSKLLRSIDYRGLALAQFKEHEATGQFYLLEINPRLSSWNALATACGVDLPYAAYCDCVGLPIPQMGPQNTKLGYLHLEHDFPAMREYIRQKDLTLWQWIRSISQPGLVYQHFAWDDTGPFWNASRAWLARQTRKLRS